MRARIRRSRCSRRRGYSLAELIVALMIGGFVLASAVSVMLSQTRAYAHQRSSTDVNETLRSGSELLAWDVRHAGIGGSPFILLDSQSIAMRSVQGVGVVCGKNAALKQYGLWNTYGDIEATADDSALIFHSATQTWRAVKISAKAAPAAGNVPLCAWALHLNPPAVVVTITVGAAADTAGVTIGAAFRSFRKVTYGEYQTADGRWWLGRKIGAAAYSQLTGPLLAPASPARAGGLSFAYTDTLGVAMPYPVSLTSVGMARITMRAQSYRTYRNMTNGVVGYRVDSLTTKVALRK